MLTLSGKELHEEARLGRVVPRDPDVPNVPAKGTNPIFFMLSAFSKSHKLYESFGFKSEIPIVAGFLLFYKIFVPFN